MKNYKYLDFITVFFITVLLISNVVSTKIVDLSLFQFDGGTLLFPLSYIFGDILTEVYGYKKMRRVIWLGFFSAILMSVSFYIIGVLPSASDWAFQEDYQNILGYTWRIVFASLIAYFVGGFLNSFVLAILKIKTKGKYLWLRTISSTIVGEFFDTVIFIFIAFYGVYEMNLLISILISNYLFKCGLEVILTPLTYKIIAFLKDIENEDVYDKDTNFSPFKID